MNWIVTEGGHVVKTVMNYWFQNCVEFLDCLR